MNEYDFDIKRPAPDNERSTFDLTALSKTMSPLVKQLFGKKGFMEIDILTNWDKIVGAELAQYSLPLKISFQKNEKTNAVLHLQVPSGAFALEIAHREKFILEKINAYFGYKAVCGIKIIQNSAMPIEDSKIQDVKKNLNYVTNEEQNYIEMLADDIKNQKLKEILIKLGHSIFNESHIKEK